MTTFVLEEKSDDHADEDDADPADPMKHLHRQLRKIRNGEKVDRFDYAASLTMPT
jgi:hypothetical protein